MKLDLATIAFNQTWPILYQMRLFSKFLTDEHELSVYDNSDDGPSVAVSRLCESFGTRYVRIESKTHVHADALNVACEDLLERGAPYIGFLDHDVYPTKPTSMIKLAENGFFGIGQRAPSGHRYLWPGFCIFSREWLDGRIPDFGGIPGADTGSMLAGLFSEQDWETVPEIHWGYEQIRPDDGHGTQSWAIERMGDWIHLVNASGWLKVPNAGERNTLLREMLEELWTSPS